MGASPTQILTVSAEEYFHAGPLSTAVRQKHWERLESRLEANTDALLELFDEHGVTATFFVLGRSAEKNPAVVRNIVSAGHEVASRGYWPKRPADMLPDEFREDLQRAKEALLAAGAPSVLGYRSLRWLRGDELWALDVLAEEGYQYDASVKPVTRPFTRTPQFHRVSRHRHSRSNLYIWEIPISTLRMPGTRIPISGGNYLRQLPDWLIRLGIEAWLRRKSAPLVFYVAPWELDEGLPLISSASRLDKVRQYRNIERTRETLGEYLARFDMCSVAEFLDLDTSRQPAPLLPPTAMSESQEVAWKDSVEEIYARPVGERTQVSLVVPLYDEEENVGYLRRTLDGLVKELAESHVLQVVLVDDCSSDDTFERLKERFADHPSYKLIRHETNRGVAGAIMTGIRAADHEVVASMDCDCSYDPSELEHMLPEIEDADMVTASPYHPEGSVLGVPSWRLFLSRNLSRLYNLVLGGDRLFTYTSCFRVVRRSSLADVELRHSGFLGVAEMLIETKLRGGRIVEHPACLESRILGASKMKTLRTIRGHLGLIAGFVLRRLTGSGAAPEKLERTAGGGAPPLSRGQPDELRQEALEG